MIMNKKQIISLILILVLFTYNTSFVLAENNQACSIQNTPEYITEYINNTKIIIWNIQKKVSKTTVIKDTHIFDNKYINQTYWALSSVFSWAWYDLDYEYIFQEKSRELPDQLKRDIKMLERTLEWIKKTSLNFSKNYSNDILLNYDEVCNQINDSKCNLIDDTETISVLNIFIKIISSTKELESLLKDQATDKKLKVFYDILLLSEEEINYIKEYYSKENIQICNLVENNNWEKWFFWKILESIKQISNNFDKSQNSMDDWQEAIDLLWWRSSDLETKQKERELLEIELNKQWIYWDSASAVLWNLEAYNNNWIILWWKYWFRNSLLEEIDWFQEVIDKEFKKKWATYISSNIISDNDINLNLTEDVSIHIDSIYGQLKNLTYYSNKEEDDLINRIIDIHLYLSDGINTLNKTCEISVKTCNEQKSWEWNCGQCY